MYFWSDILSGDATGNLGIYSLVGDDRAIVRGSSGEKLFSYLFPSPAFSLFCFLLLFLFFPILLMKPFRPRWQPL